MKHWAVYYAPDQEHGAHQQIGYVQGTWVGDPDTNLINQMFTDYCYHNWGKQIVTLNGNKVIRSWFAVEIGEGEFLSRKALNYANSLEVPHSIKLSFGFHDGTVRHTR